MNQTLSKRGKEYLKELLPKCTETQQFMFKRMYSYTDLENNINQVVDDMPDEKIDWAISQVERTIEKNNKATL